MRLIDADEMAVNESEAYMEAQLKIDSPVMLGINSIVHRKIQKLIADTPTIDAVPVVRCKECKSWMAAAMKCKHPRRDFRFEMYCTGDDFCSYGERMDKEDKP